MTSINGDTVIMSDAPLMPPVTSQVHPPWQAPCWKFEKLQIMLLGFGYLESSEKSEKKYTNTTHIGLYSLKFTRPNDKY